MGNERHQSIALHEAGRVGRQLGIELRDQQMLQVDLGLQGGVRVGVATVEGGADDRYGASTGRDRCSVRHTVDALGQPTDHDDLCLGELCGELGCPTNTFGRGRTGADNRHPGRLTCETEVTCDPDSVRCVATLHRRELTEQLLACQLGNILGRTVHQVSAPSRSRRGSLDGGWHRPEDPIS